MFREELVTLTSTSTSRKSERSSFLKFWDMAMTPEPTIRLRRLKIFEMIRDKSKTMLANTILANLNIPKKTEILERRVPTTRKIEIRHVEIVKFSNVGILKF